LAGGGRDRREKIRGWSGGKKANQLKHRTQTLEVCYNVRHTMLNHAHIWGRHYQAKIQDIQQRTTTSTCMMLKSGSLAETPKSKKKTHAFGQDITTHLGKTLPRSRSLQKRRTHLGKTLPLSFATKLTKDDQQPVLLLPAR